MGASATAVASVEVKTLRDFRLEKGETLQQVGEAIGVRPGVVSAWELGRWKPHPRFIPMLARHFDVIPQLIRQAIEQITATTE